MSYLYLFLSFVMDWCYGLCNSYGWAIVLFTFLSKIVLLPVSLWTYMNSITMIKIQPDINFLKVKYYGQKDVIAEEQAKLFKEKKYHPLASTIPLFIQLVLLMGVVGAIRSGIENPAIDMSFGPMDLGMVPNENGVSLLWSPAIAGFSAWILCIAQNASNVLQSEQSKYNKYGTMIFSVGLSLYLGWYVPIGTALYWICSNLMAVIQLYILNGIIKPRRFVDYEKLEKSREALNEIQSVGKKQKNGMFSDNKRRERRDYKRFFSVVNKHLVFYSESNGFYKYFKGIIEYLLLHTNIIIHYITSDPNDAIFELEKDNAQIKAYYIGENRLITLMMKMDADMVLMTVPDLNRFHIKRSYIREDIEYVYVFHYPLSATISFHPEGLKGFDTVLCTGQFQVDEIRKREEVYQLPAKNLVVCGYGQLDNLKVQYENMSLVERKRKKILLAPSWQLDNILDSCVDGTLGQLLGKGWDIYLRPHPEYIKRYKNRMDAIVERYKDVPTKDLFFELDFTSNNSLFDSDIVITDWSGAAYEFAYVTGKPVVFIDTTMKCNNPEYEKIGIEPLEITLRSQVGVHLPPDKLSDLHEKVQYLLEHTEEYITNNIAIRNKYVANYGHSGEAAGKYIIASLKDKAAKRNEI